MKIQTIKKVLLKSSGDIPQSVHQYIKRIIKKYNISLHNDYSEFEIEEEEKPRIKIIESLQS